jgi:hypothetical protein
MSAGGGYSSRRSSLKNVGIYGGIPRHSKQGGQQKGGSADRGTGTWDEGTNPDADQAGAGAAAGKSRASGESDAAVPVKYRKQVGDYFQRVADELGDK